LLYGNVHILSYTFDLFRSNLSPYVRCTNASCDCYFHDTYFIISLKTVSVFEERLKTSLCVQGNVDIDED